MGLKGLTYLGIQTPVFSQTSLNMVQFYDFLKQICRKLQSEDDDDEMEEMDKELVNITNHLKGKEHFI